MPIFHSVDWLFKGSVLALCNKAKSRLGNGRFARNICTKIHKLAQRNVKFALKPYFTSQFEFSQQ